MRRRLGLAVLLATGLTACGGPTQEPAPAGPAPAVGTSSPGTALPSTDAGGSGGRADSVPNGSGAGLGGTSTTGTGESASAAPTASAPAGSGGSGTAGAPGQSTSGGGASTSAAPSPALPAVVLPPAGTTTLAQTGREVFQTPLGDDERALPATAVVRVSGTGAGRQVLVTYSPDRTDTFVLRQRADSSVVLVRSTTLVRYAGIDSRVDLAPTPAIVVVPADPRAGATSGGAFTASSSGTYRTTVLAADATTLTTRFQVRLTSGPARGTTTVTISLDRRTGSVRSVTAAVDATQDGSRYVQTARLTG